MAGSFSGETKELLSRVPLKPRSQRLAELHALAAGIGDLDVKEDGSLGLMIQSENLPAVRRGDFLMRALSGCDLMSSVFTVHGGSPVYTVTLEDHRATVRLLQELGFMNRRGVLREEGLPAPEGMLKNEACRRAFLRGAFLAGGYVSDPEGAYHWEVVTTSEARAQELAALLKDWGLPARATVRKGKNLVYIKSSEAISSVLSLMGAYQSTLQWENARAYRSLQGQVNRQVNCDLGNSAKVSQAGENQIRAIQTIQEKAGLASLPRPLQDIARLRLANPDLPLKDLGALLDPPVGKSGVNHRLRKLLQIADELS